MFTVIKWIFFTISVFFIFYVLLTENVFSSGPPSTTLICDKFLPKKIPEIKGYSRVHIFRIGIFNYKWYFSSTEPLKVQALIVEAGVGLIRYTWEIDGKIYTVRKEVNEMICVHKIRNGYDLTKMYKLLIKNSGNQLDLTK